MKPLLALEDFKMKTKTLLCGVLFMFTLASKAEVGEFQITFKVVDEAGNPMPKVNVGASFVQSTSLIPTANNISEKQVDIITDKDGKV